MEQLDLILLVLICLSVLIGLSRGFCSEILRIAVYVFSCVSGYFIAPVFSPVFTFVPHEAIQKCIAVLLGTFVTWLILKIITVSLIKSVKNSRFNKLDRSLGAFFGLTRAFLFVALISVGVGMVFPHIVQKSKILSLSYSSVSALFEGTPLFEKIKQEDEKEKREEADLNENTANEDQAVPDQDWKKRLLHYMQNASFDTKDGKKPLISSVSSIAAEVTFKNMRKETSSDENGDEIMPEDLKKALAVLYEEQITAFLNGEKLNETSVDETILEKLKESFVQNENLGD